MASRDASVTLPFADGSYHFRLGWEELILLQEARDCGPWWLLNRLLGMSWFVEDIAETLRCGLIGGGLDPASAARLVDLYVRRRVPLENLVTAQQVLGAGLAGAGSEEVLGKGSAANQGTQTPNSHGESSDLPPSMETAP